MAHHKINKHFIKQKLPLECVYRIYTDASYCPHKSGIAMLVMFNNEIIKFKSEVLKCKSSYDAEKYGISLAIKYSKHFTKKSYNKVIIYNDNISAIAYFNGNKSSNLEIKHLSRRDNHMKFVDRFSRFRRKHPKKHDETDKVQNRIEKYKQLYLKQTKL